MNEKKSEQDLQIIKKPEGEAAAEGEKAAAQPEKPRKNVKKEVREWVVSIAVALIAVILIRTFLFTVIKVEGPSMNDTLWEGDRLIVTIADMKINGPQRFDVVITHFPDSDKRYVKRVIALPGETLEIRDGVTYIDGEPLDEPFVTHPSTSDFGPYTVPEGQYMVLGDNRSNSHDSRADDVGPVDEDMIIGKVRFIMWPFSHFGVVE